MRGTFRGVLHNYFFGTMRDVCIGESGIDTNHPRFPPSWSWRVIFARSFPVFLCQLPGWGRGQLRFKFTLARSSQNHTSFFGGKAPSKKGQVADMKSLGKQASKANLSLLLAVVATKVATLSTVPISVSTPIFLFPPFPLGRSMPRSPCAPSQAGGRP